MKSLAFLFGVCWIGLALTVSGAEKYESLRQSLENFAYTHPGNISISFTDLTNNRKVAIAEDRLFNPASVIKVPVMVEVYNQVYQHKLSLDDHLVLRKSDKIAGSGSLQFQKTGNAYSIRTLVELMITLSDNTATHMLIERVGKENINRTMREIGLKNTLIGNSDLLKAEGLNFSTPGDMTLLLTKIYHGHVVSRLASDDMLAVMGRQHVKWGIPKYLPSQVRVANKTGTLAYVKNDTGIVFVDDRPYVISVFTSKAPTRPFGTTWVAQISRIVYDWRMGDSESEYGYVN
jgi:beta-lactamase class A